MPRNLIALFGDNFPSIGILLLGYTTSILDLGNQRSRSSPHVAAAAHACFVRLARALYECIRVRRWKDGLRVFDAGKSDAARVAAIDDT